MTSKTQRRNRRRGRTQSELQIRVVIGQAEAAPDRDDTIRVMAPENQFILTFPEALYTEHINLN